MEKREMILSALLARTIRDVMQIAPKAVLTRFFGDIITSAAAGLNTYLMAALIQLLTKYQEYEDNLKQILLYIALVILLSTFSKLVNSFCVNSRVKVESTTLYRFNIKISEKCHKVPLIRYEEPAFLDSLHRARDCIYHARLSGISLSLLNIISELLSVISILIVLASFSFYLVPISVLSILPILIVRLVRGAQFYELRWFQAAKERKMRYLYSLFNNKNSMKEIRMMDIGDYLQDKWNGVKDESSEEVWAFKKKDIAHFSFCDLLKVAGYAACIVFVLLMTLRGRLDIGMMSVSIVAFTTFQSETAYFFVNVARLPEYAAYTKDFYSFLDQEEEDWGAEECSQWSDIRAEDISFTYPNAHQPAINHLSLHIKKGETVVILGENGSGKTTLVMLLLGLFRCDAGTIRYGDLHLDDINLDSLFRNVSIVPQNFSKYNLSLRENISVGNMSRLHDDEDMLQILKKLKLEELLDENGPGLDGMMGKEFGGKELSVGQWQKIAIARSLFKNCEINILDEPTAALDPIIESEILKEFILIAKGKTSIIISHRVGLCKEADKIIVMKDGAAVECGTHQELMGNAGEYRRLYTAQSQWYT